MLLDIKCKAISSIRVHLVFDDETTKDDIICIGDLIDVTYNGNGMRKHIIGRVSNISTVGADPNNWYIIVDGSDDFARNGARFSPMAILDLEIIRKADQQILVKSPIGMFGVPWLRINKGRLQYSRDGFEWHYIVIDDENVIEDDGTDNGEDQLMELILQCIKNIERRKF